MQQIWTNCEHRGRGQLCVDSERQSVEIKGIFLRFWCVQRQTLNYDAYSKLLPNKASLNWHWNVTPLDIKAPISLVFSCSGYWGTNQNPFSWQSEKWRLQPASKNLKKCQKKRQRKERLICFHAAAVLAKLRSIFPFREKQNSPEGFPCCKMCFHSTSDSLWQPMMPQSGDTAMPGSGKKSLIGPHGM